jgi:anti-sigma regulatory factor (Ser/Thr protein kinase)
MTPAGTGPPSATRAATATTPRTHHQVFPAHADQVSHARRFLADVLASYSAADAILCLSELASNSVIHSASRQPGGTFTVRAEIYPGDRLRIEVHDQGGSWARPIPGEEQRGHGLHIISQLARTWGITGDGDTGWTVWAVLDWPPSGPPASASQDTATARASDPFRHHQSSTQRSGDDA